MKSSSEMIAPSARLAPFRWTRKSLEASSSWMVTASEALEIDARILEAWADLVKDPVKELRLDSLTLPGLDALAAKVANEISVGTGVALVRGLPPMSERTLRLMYLALGLRLGSPVETYGRLYDVRDTNVSYRTSVAPVSQTRESTGMHTDSSARDVCPAMIALLCVRPASHGGDSRLTSAVEVHEQLRENHPELLEHLYAEFMRDIVTPGSDRSPDAVARNRFPIFSWRDDQLRFRYMRYWIERGHLRANAPLEPISIAAFDALDAALADPANVATFRMGAGEMLFIDNTTIAHDRDAFEDHDPTNTRLMVRLWLDARPQSYSLHEGSSERPTLFDLRSSVGK